MFDEFIEVIFVYFESEIHYIFVSNSMIMPNV